ncbi:hypothetical protein QTP86_008125 [Hemibagrus guttatus]|nr:hypothetical protein QTP86_008125 [Hemibagrus guttatus]
MLEAPPTVRIVHSGHACNVEEERYTERVYTIREGETLELTCLVTGHPRPQKISARIKGKVYRTVVRPAMLYGLETVSLRKRQESELEVAELKMLRFDGLRQQAVCQTVFKIQVSLMRHFTSLRSSGTKVDAITARLKMASARRQLSRSEWMSTDAASLLSAEDGPDETCFFFLFIAGTRSASFLIGGGDRRPHLPPSLPVGAFGPAGLRSSLISTTHLDDPVVTVHQSIGEAKEQFYYERTVFLRCVANSNPPVRYSWHRGRDVLSQGSDKGVEIYEPFFTQVMPK